MASAAELLVVFCTAPDAETGARLSRGLVDARLAACVNVVPGLKSIYRWEGRIEEDDEVQLVIKTSRGCFDRVAAWLDEHHPYDVPEIVALPAERVSEPYLAWALKATHA